MKRIYNSLTAFAMLLKLFRKYRTTGWRFRLGTNDISYDNSKVEHLPSANLPGRLCLHSQLGPTRHLELSQRT